MKQTHPNAAQIVADFEAWGAAADRGEIRPRDVERDRLELEARIRSPKRSTTDQADAGHLPLFIAANEPALL